MYSFNFPDMVSNTSARLLKDHEATASNLKLLLLSDKYSLFGDPYFGTRLKRMLFNQNNSVLRDLVVDDIYTSIIEFMPQLVTDRNNITVTSDGEDVYVSIKATNVLDYQTDLYNIRLTQSEEE